MFGMELLDERQARLRIGTLLADNRPAALTPELGAPRLVDAGTIGADGLTDGTALESLNTAVVQRQSPHRLFVVAELAFDHGFVLRASRRRGDHAGARLEGLAQVCFLVDRLVVVD